jgi:predicted metal-dependent peptidase
MDRDIANVAMDMLINTWLLGLSKRWMKMPTCGKENTVPKEYGGLKLWEPLYHWLMEKKSEYEAWKTNDQEKNENGGSDDSSSEKQQTECPVSEQLQKIFENPTTVDDHKEMELSPEQIKHIMEEPLRALKSRGLVPAEVERELERINKQRKDHLRDIKRTIGSMKGGTKVKTFMRPNRKGIDGLKGKRRIGSVINVLLDTSGSMWGEFEKVLSYIFQNDIEINLVQCDTKVHCTEKLKSLKDVSRIKIKGSGGTILQPGIDHMRDNLPQHGTVILTDGYCDALDFSGFKKKVLVVTSGCNPRITRGLEKVKFINTKDN